MRANGNSTYEILGKIVTAIASIAMTAAFAVPAMAASDSDTAANSGTTQQSGQYKIYPQPQNTEYGDGSLILRDKANTVVEPGIDSATKARLNEALKLKGIETTATPCPKPRTSSTCWSASTDPTAWSTSTPSS